MNSLQFSNFVSFLTTILISASCATTEIGDYIVDCSACNYLPLKGVDSYRCNVRCEAQGGYYLLQLIDLNSMTCMEI